VLNPIAVDFVVGVALVLGQGLALKRTR